MRFTSAPKVNSCDTCISVVMPVYNQATFICCAIKSLLEQSFQAWELIVVDDGSKDDVQQLIAPFLQDERIRYLRNELNKGLGYSLNRGIDNASYPLIAYLPADDIYFNDHLESLAEAMTETGADLVYSGITYNEGNTGGENPSKQSKGKIDGRTLQLVQVLHRKTELRWLERSEIVTDDLDRMFWDSFRKAHNNTHGTRKITCQWVSHLYQRHTIMNDRGHGGIYMYKKYYGVTEPIRYRSSVGNDIDEIARFERFRKPSDPDKNGLKILLVGELAYNPERILALEERGHKLYGLWIDNPMNFNTVGPLPFGNVEDIPLDKWEERVKEIKPDIIYALLNFQAVNLAHHVLTRNPGIPFVWHFKEGPFYCRTMGLWEKLVDLYTRSNGIIHTNDMIRRWFEMFIPVNDKPTFILDGDLPKKEWFAGKRQEPLSKQDGQIHTVIAGRVLGITADDIEKMASQGVHLHVYGDIFHNQSRGMLDEAMALAPDHLHLHPNCPQENWVSEFSLYDAGWLHYFKSENEGDLLRANWIDINSPARMATYAMAGIPMVMHNNNGHAVHHQQYLEAHDMAITIDAFDQLKSAFDDKDKIARIRQSTWDEREIFCFDHYADDLISFFRTVITAYYNNKTY